VSIFTSKRVSDIRPGIKILCITTHCVGNGRWVRNVKCAVQNQKVCNDLWYLLFFLRYFLNFIFDLNILLNRRRKKKFKKFVYQHKYLH